MNPFYIHVASILHPPAAFASCNQGTGRKSYWKDGKRRPHRCLLLSIAAVMLLWDVEPRLCFWHLSLRFVNWGNTNWEIGQWTCHSLSLGGAQPEARIARFDTGIGWCLTMVIISILDWCGQDWSIWSSFCKIGYFEGLPASPCRVYAFKLWAKVNEEP